jgi:hypothetical protein
VTGSGGPDDGAQVDVEAAWAQIVMHWDDDAPAAGAADPDRVNEEGTGAAGRVGTDDPPGVPPLLPPADPAGPLPPAAGPADLRSPPRPERRPRPEPAPPPAAADPSAAPAPSEPSVWRGPTRPDDSTQDDSDAGGYVPDEPPPLPRGDLVSWLSWGGVLGAPVFLLLAALFWRTAPSLLVAAAVTAFVVGFGTLVVRLPDRREDDGDDGAVV